MPTGAMQKFLRKENVPWKLESEVKGFIKPVLKPTTAKPIVKPTPATGIWTKQK